MSGTEASSGKRLWSDVVASTTSKTLQTRESKVETSRAPVTWANPHSGTENKKRAYYQPSAQKQWNRCKGLPTYENPRCDPQRTARPGFVKKDCMPIQASTTHNLEKNRGNFNVRNSASGSRGDHENIIEPVDELEMMKDKLEKKDIFIDQEKYFKDAAEKDSLAYLEKIKEVESRLEAERQLTLVCEEELNQCKGIIEDLLQSSKTLEEDSEVKSITAEDHKSVLDEIENLKKQLEEETRSNLDLISKLEVQEGVKESLQFKFAELTEQLESALETSEVSGDESSVAETVSEMISVSSQTEDAAFENVSEQQELSNLPADVCDESSKPEDFPPDRRHTELVEQTVASEPEKVSELKKTTETELVSKHDGSSKQKAKKRRRRKKTKSQQSEDTNQVIEHLSQPEDASPKENLISQELVTKVGLSEPEGVSELVGADEKESVSKPEDVSKHETEKVSPKEPGPDNNMMLELTEKREQSEVRDNLAAKVEESKPVPTTETALIAEQDGVFEQKPKKETCRREKKSNVTDNMNQFEVIEELPEPQDAVTTEDSDSDVNSKRVYNPSLWRRFKKFLTPACLRQYKHKKKDQDPE